MTSQELAERIVGLHDMSYAARVELVTKIIDQKIAAAVAEKIERDAAQQAARATVAKE